MGVQNPVKAGPALSSGLLADVLAVVAETSAVLDPNALLPAIAKALRRIVQFRILDIFLPDPDGTLRPVIAPIDDVDCGIPATPRRAGWW